MYGKPWDTVLDFHRNTGESLPSATLKYPTNNMNMKKTKYINNEIIV